MRLALCLSGQPRTWRWTRESLLAFFAGELYYSLHLTKLDDPPFPSLADGFYLAFYPLAYAGLVLCPPRQQGTQGAQRQIIDA